jgi:intracellular multiplication protein IcmT
MIDPATHWRDSARPARFFIVDANIIYPIMIFFFNINKKTSIFLILSFIFFFAMDRTNFNINRVIRYAKVCISGNMRYRKGWWQ